METALLQPLEALLQSTTNTYCGRASHLFTKKLKQSIMSLQQDLTQRWSGEHFNIIPWGLSDYWLETLLWRHWVGWKTHVEPSCVYKFHIKTMEMWSRSNLWNRLNFCVFEVKWMFITCLSSEHTIRSQMLSQHGGKCTETTLPCRDFGLHCWQGHLL